MSFCLVAALLPLALACGPGTGPLHSTATYKFAILPPLGWTYPVNGVTPNSAQSKDSATALSKAKEDVWSAITLTLIQSNIPSSGVNFTLNYSHNATGAVDKKSCADGVDNTFVIYKGTLYYACSSTAPQTSMAINRGTIILTSSTPISEDQWKTLAVKVQDNLLPRNVVFQENLVVSYGA